MSEHTNLPYGHQTIEEEDLRAVLDVLRSDWLTQGPAVERFEQDLTGLCGARHAIVVSSGTAALHLAALAAGVGPGDVVVTSPNTFVATANSVRYAGGEPRFADIDPATLNLEPEALSRVVASLEGRVRGVIPVHFAGLPADMERISALARRHGLFVIEDASHALGASFRDREGRWHRVGSCSHSDMATLSFHPVKHVTTGEGGAILTSRDDLAERIRTLRTHGIVRDPARLSRSDGGWYYEMEALGFNYRITDFQCALGSAQLRRLSRWLERRAAIVARYRSELRSDPRVGFVIEPEGTRPAWHLCPIRVPNRAEVYRRLRARGIGVQVHYIPVHLHPYYRRLLGTREGDFPHAEAYYRQALSLPLYPGLRDEDVDRVILELRAALDGTE